MMEPDMRKGPVNRFGEGTDGVNEGGNADWGVAAGVAATRGGDCDAASMLEEWMQDFKIFEKEAIRVFMTTVLKLTEIFPRGYRYRPEMTFCLYCPNQGPNINANAEGGKDCRRARLIGEAVNFRISIKIQLVHQLDTN